MDDFKGLFNPNVWFELGVSLGFNGLYDMLVKTRMINLLESNGVTAEYISGEREAFEELAREVRKAKHSLRTTRFANQSIIATETKQQCQ